MHMILIQLLITVLSHIQMLENALTAPTPVNKCVLTHKVLIDVPATVVLHSIAMDSLAVVSIVLEYMEQAQVPTYGNTTHA